MITLIHVKIGAGLESQDFTAINKIPSGLPETIDERANLLWHEFLADTEGSTLIESRGIISQGFKLSINMMDYNPLRMEWFLDAYSRHYNKARDEKPEEYSGDRKQVLARMYKAILEGSFNKDGEGFKRTCKQLGINRTYKAIDAYLKGQ
jgi:hypothetical protein